MHSRDLANFIIAAHSDFTFDANNSELITFIKNREIEQLAMWLNFNSFIKWQIKQVATKYFNEQENMKSAIRRIVLDCLRIQRLKADIKKYKSEDFLTDDYIDFVKILSGNDIYSPPKNNQEANQQPIKKHHLQILVNAKNRRNTELNRHFNGVCIAETEDDDEKNHSFNLLIDQVTNIKRGERKQIFYYHENGPHAFCFDIERDANGQLNIFCFESAGDQKQVQTLDLLCKVLNQRGEKFNIKACLAKMQRDTFNCSVFAFAVMNEISKYPRVFDYLPKDKDLKPYDIHTYIADRNNEIEKEQDIGFVFTPQEKIAVGPEFDKVQWVDFSDMPTKVISMSQSYQHMRENLNNSKDFDMDADAFINQHKRRHEFDDDNPQQTKYINRRRQHIGGRLDKKQISIFREDKYRETLAKHPLLKALESGSTEVQKFIKDMPPQEKLRYLENAFSIIYTRNEMSENLRSIRPPAKELQKLLALKTAYLQILIHEIDIDETKAIINTDSNHLILCDLSSYLNCYHIDHSEFERLASVLCKKISFTNYNDAIERSGLPIFIKRSVEMNSNPILAHLGDKTAFNQDLVMQILNRMDCNEIQKLKYLESAFENILLNKGNVYPSHKVSDRSQNTKQIADISILKKVYLEVVKQAVARIKDGTNNGDDLKHITAKSSYKPKLIDYNTARFKSLAKETSKSRTLLDSMLETLPNSQKTIIPPK